MRNETMSRTFLFLSLALAASQASAQLPAAADPRQAGANPVYQSAVTGYRPAGEVQPPDQGWIDANRALSPSPQASHHGVPSPHDAEVHGDPHEAHRPHAGQQQQAAPAQAAPGAETKPGEGARKPQPTQAHPAHQSGKEHQP